MINLKTLGAGIGLLAGLAMADLPLDTIQGHITADKLLDSNHVWIIKGRCTVDSGVTLTIQPGTTLKGQYSTRGTLAIKPRAFIIAAGTKEHPINFTATENRRGGWGGLVLLGRAPTNEPTKYFEAVPEWSYGGNDAHDSSGVLTYITINWPGFAVEVDKELNGFTFCGVGDRTVVKYLQSNNGDDDAFEWFGGTVNGDHLIATNQADDGFDLDNGFSGTARWLIQIQGKDPAQVRHYYFYTASGDTAKNTDGSYHDTTYTEKVGDAGVESSSNPVAGKVPQTQNHWSNLTIIDNGTADGVFQQKENGGGYWDRMLLIADSSAWVVQLKDQNTANDMIMANPVLQLTHTYYGGTFLKKWDVKDTTVVGKGAATLLDSTVKFVGAQPIYKDLGLVEATGPLVTDSVGAILGNDTANYWYKGWTLPGTVMWSKGKERVPSAIAARFEANRNSISFLGMRNGSLVINADAAASARIQFLDLSGRVVLDLGAVQLRQGRNVVAKGSIRGLNNGLYFVKAKMDDKAYSAKILLSATEAGR